MEKETYKPIAKCKYHDECSFYNNSVLPPEVEIKMCGRGRPVSKNYQPMIPKPEIFTPSESYALGPGGVCDAYCHYNEIHLIAKLRNHIADMKNSIDKQGFW